jgi:hypothetical protein
MFALFLDKLLEKRLHSIRHFDEKPESYGFYDGVFLLDSTVGFDTNSAIIWLMRLKLALGLLSISLALSCAAVSTSNLTAAQAAPPSPTPAASPPAAEKFTGPGDKFSILLPAKPTEIKQNAKPGEWGSYYPGQSVNDGVTARYKWILPEGLFFVAVTDLKTTSFKTSEDLSKYLTGVRGRFDSLSSFWVESQKPITLDGFDGAEFIQNNPYGHKAFTRIYVKGQRMYTLRAETEKPYEVNTPLVIAKLDSFTIAE